MGGHLQVWSALPDEAGTMSADRDGAPAASADRGPARTDTPDDSGDAPGRLRGSGRRLRCVRGSWCSASSPAATNPRSCARRSATSSTRWRGVRCSRSSWKWSPTDRCRRFRPASAVEEEWAGTHRVGQGTIVYSRHIETNRLLTLADSIRVGDDLGRFHLQYLGDFLRQRRRWFSGMWVGGPAHPRRAAPPAPADRCHGAVVGGLVQSRVLVDPVRRRGSSGSGTRAVDTVALRTRRTVVW